MGLSGTSYGTFGLIIRGGWMFGSKIQELEERLIQSQRRVRATGATVEEIESLTAELSGALEELRVAEEELTRQGDALLANGLDEDSDYRDLFMNLPEAVLSTNERGL